MMNLATQQPTSPKTGLLPTRQQLVTYLRSKNINPAKLNHMTAWEHVQLTKEYQKSLNG